MAKKALVTYFSCSGVTAMAAKQLAAAIDAPLYEIKPQTAYTTADLDWTNKQSRSSVEMNDLSFRPALADHDAPIGEYDIIYIGFPVWWYVAPTIINSFLEAYDFSNKTVVLFATSGGSGFGKTVEHLKPSAAADTRFVQGRLLNGRISDDELCAWVKSLNL